MIQKEALWDSPIIAKGTLLAGKYIVNSRLAQTDLSVIFSGINRDTEEPVAIKAINQSSLEKAKKSNDPLIEEIIWQMFYNEELILSNLNHAGIPKSYGQHFQYVSGNRIPIRIMEYVPLHLDSFFKNRPFLPRLAEFIIQFSGILSYLHENGIIHSDIKPQNIMCNRDEIKLIDFNTASHSIDPHYRHAHPRNIVRLKDGYQSMTAAFAPPEVKKGCRAVFASDIYSFSRVLDSIIIANSDGNYSILKNDSRKTLSRGKEPDKGDNDIGKIITALMDMPSTLFDIRQKCSSEDIDKRISPSELCYMGKKLLEDSKKNYYK